MSSSQDASARDLLNRYEPVIGLEVHCQLKTQSKLFCSCSTEFGAIPNQNTCPVCLGMPGVLPVINRVAVDYAIKLALAVDAEIRHESIFARKQYFYPDLPKGYQISQYDKPYCENGLIRLESGRKIRVMRIHMEEDAGKNVHGDNASYVDLNRAGIPLLEIVSQPDIRTPQEAAEYLRKIRALVCYLEISDGNLEEGSFRCDANISLRPRGSETLGTRTEIKNLNSFRNIEKAITYEIFRQADVLDHGGSIEQMTLQYDASSGKTLPMRSKEESHDYRYFPDPDLKPLVLRKERIEQIRQTLPELPGEKQRRFSDDFGLSDYDAEQIVGERDLALYFEKVVELVDGAVTPKIVANWILTELMREVHNHNWDLAKLPITTESMAKLLKLLGSETISGKIAKRVFELMVAEGKEPDVIVKEHALVQVTDEQTIRDTVMAVIDANPQQVEQFLSGKDKIMGFFVGQIMKQSQGKFNPAIVNRLLKELLDARKKS
ncbi:MAG: Asp-tRNA(Asn)/Glu-tRNA(Gln) amidotransferase subunit GatB [Oligoflexus sp.]